jgi:aspartokinase/homoserine dehydrogenase 1
VAEAERPVALVVSALGDSTEWLLDAGAAAVAGDAVRARASLERVLALVRARGAEVLGPEALGELERPWADIVEDGARALATLREAGATTPAALDLLLSVGERLSSQLVAAALRASGLPGLAVDAREIFRTDDRHGDASVDLGASLRPVLERRAHWERHIPVLTGFIGRTPDGATATLGRNGSDYAATTLAALLGAPEVPLWTAVGGEMTADPELVEEAYPVPRRTWHEAQELAHFGLRMFHRRTVLPLEKSGGRLRIRSTMDAGEGTVIDAQGNPDPHRPTCVTSLENLALLSVESRRPAPETSLAVRVLSALEQAQIRVWMVTQSGHGQSLAAVVDAAAAERARAVLEAALAELLAPGEVELPPAKSPVSLVSLVAEAMGQWPNVAGRFFGALGNVGINVRAIAQGASSRSIGCVVDAADTAEAVRTVHAAFNLAQTEVNVLLLGRGTVGGRLLAQLEATRESLRARQGIDARLFGVVDRHGAHVNPRGLLPSELPPRASGPAGSPPEMTGLLDRLSRLPVPVLVDCTAADGMEALYVEAFRRGIHVGAANKKPLALPLARRAQVFDMARRHFRAWHYETTVGAGLPVIETLKNLVATGDVIERIDGSLSGTLGFLCQEVMAGTPLSVAVRVACDRGTPSRTPRRPVRAGRGPESAHPRPRAGAAAGARGRGGGAVCRRRAPGRGRPRALPPAAGAARRGLRRTGVPVRAAGRTLRYLVQIVPGPRAGRCASVPWRSRPGTRRPAARRRGAGGLHHRPLPGLPPHRSRRGRRWRRDRRGRARRRPPSHPERSGSQVAPSPTLPTGGPCRRGGFRARRGRLGRLRGRRSCPAPTSRPHPRPNRSAWRSGGCSRSALAIPGRLADQARRAAGGPGAAGAVLRPAPQCRPGAGGEPAVRAGARPAARGAPPSPHRARGADQEGRLPPGCRGAADAAPERADPAGAAPAHLPPAPAHRPLPAQRGPRDAGEEQDRQPRGVPARWSSGLSEEKVDTLFRTEGRILAQLVGLAMDQKSASIFCHRTVTSLLLVQSLARWAGTPPSVLAHLLKQAVVRNQPQVRMLILKHPNLPSHARAGSE